ncbi:MAG: hypothetical protein QGG34_05345 [SAR202 cluster bacterium]|nr:hypothetical protein [SAR202 cluster bacterium]MDP7224297.1 hypothetical protein [SAR202 cluster bacterium]HJO81931.1 hypothetical protein [SAR202 cluster bacterium]
MKQDGIEVLVSNVMAPYLRGIQIEAKRFPFMRTLRASLELRNGTMLHA